MVGNNYACQFAKEVKMKKIFWISAVLVLVIFVAILIPKGK